MQAVIKCIEYYLPEKVLTNAELTANTPNWDAEKIKSKTGISERHIAPPNVCASDLAYMAAKKILDKKNYDVKEIEFLLFCTQSADYLLPTTACILQDRLNLSTSCGALDFNLGCSGYTVGLGLAKALIENGQAKNVLLLTADTYTKYLDPNDISTRSIFGDAGTATLVCSVDSCSDKCQYISQPVYGTDGRGAENLLVRNGGMRARGNLNVKNDPRDKFLYMNGPEIFRFTIESVPKLIDDVLAREQKTMDDIDLFIFHQANEYILEYLRNRTQIPRNKFYVALENTGNTVSSSIPIAMRKAYDENILREGACVMLVGFGIGYSLGGVIVHPFIN